MLSSISPFGERARASRWWLTTTAYVLASALGGIALGTLAALLGSLVPEAWRWSPVALVVGALLLLVGLVLDTGWAGLSLPSWRRQVDEAWIGRYRGWVVGLGFGAQLGFGLGTIITSSTTYAVVGLALLTGTPWAGALVGLVFGVVRAVPLVLMAGVDTRDRLHTALRVVSLRARLAETVARVGLTSGAAALVWTALRGAV